MRLKATQGSLRESCMDAGETAYLIPVHIPYAGIDQPYTKPLIVA
jgi:hypothetical protein